MTMEEILKNQERHFLKENVFDMFFYWQYDHFPDKEGNVRPFLSFKTIPRSMVQLLQKTMICVGIYESDDSIMIPIFVKKDVETDARRYFSKNKKIKLMEFFNEKKL